MARVRPDSVLTIGGIGIGGSLGGTIASLLGYSGLFTIGLLVAAIGIWLTYRWLDRDFPTSGGFPARSGAVRASVPHVPLHQESASAIFN